eukprot:GHUV01005462.1.p1 GENE.GHUV01005462.1~~GHUV01005462.1.p1  ORF type:complete len:291 (+),score=77.83 GHUV01005462.1:83-874(+)
MASTLIVFQGSCLPLGAFQALMSQNDIAQDSADITTDPTRCTTSGYGKALMVLSHTDPTVLGAVCKLLKPGATVVLNLPRLEQGDASSAMLLSGFTDCQASTSGGSTTVTAKTPDFAAGAKDSLRLKPKQPAAAPAAVAAPASNAWMLSGDDIDGAEELMDDEELLTEEDRQRPAVSKQDDCEVGAGGARKACKNCSCGRAEAEAKGEKVKLTQEMLDNPVSSCGNCSLGDAFRCAGCPYRGLPSFQPGKKITLPADFLTADA